MHTLAELTTRRTDLMRRLDDGDDRCWAHDPHYGNGPDAWERKWLGLLDEYCAVEEAIKWHAAQPTLIGVR